MGVAPPRPKGPPLNALRAFEAAARLGGFNNAAQELCVTPGAISQHIKTLEAWAEVKLFERHSQGVVLTEVGHALVKDFSLAFDALGDAVSSLRAKTAITTIHIAALPSIAQLWLSPRMPEIRKTLPDTNISITALEKPPNLKRELFDISLFFKEKSKQASEIVLEEDIIYPVCSPTMAEFLKDSTDLMDVVCLSDVFWPSDWSTWLRKAAPKIKINKSGPSYSLFSIAVEEAKTGAGVLIGHQPLIQDKLNAGELVAPFSQRINTEKPLVLNYSDTANTDVMKLINVLRDSKQLNDTF